MSTLPFRACAPATRELAARMLAVLAVLLAWCLTALPASAHAVLIEAHPLDGESLATAPAELSLRFNEPVTVLAMSLLDARGEAVPGVEAHGQDELVTVRLPADLPPGGYFLSYRVASLDTHAVAAVLRFGIGAPAPGAEVRPSAPTAGWAAALARWLVYATALGSSGLALFLLAVRPPPAVAARGQRLVPWLALAGLPALLLRFAVVGLDLVGDPAAALLTAAPWRAALASSVAPATALAVLGLLLLAGGRRRWQHLVAALLIAASFALTGHAAAAQPRWLAGSTLAVHVLAAAFWLGAFLPLAWCLVLDGPAAAAVLRRFSRQAWAMLACLILAGATLAWLQLAGTPSALWQDAYGQRLLVKLSLVAGLLAMAALNRLWLTPALAARRAGAAPALRLTLGLDLALALAVLLVTATFPFSPPPRATALMAAAESGVTVVAGGRGVQAGLTLIPGRPGANRLEIQLATPEGVPLAARAVDLAWSLPEAGLGPLRVAAETTAPGIALAKGFALPRAGRWRLRLGVLVDDFTKLDIEAEIDIR